MFFVFLRLTKKKPFHGKDMKSILTKNKLGSIDFKIDELKIFSQDSKLIIFNFQINVIKTEAIDLLTKMLKANPVERITVEEAIDHPFFANDILFNPLLTITKHESDGVLIK